MALLPPGDRIPEDTALELVNFRTDKAGHLVGRLGHAEALTSLGGAVHSIVRANAARYTGAASALNRGNTEIETGFTGERLGLVDSQGFLWVMDRNVRGKDDGTDFTNWGIEAPESAPTAEAGGEITEEVASFDNDESWSDDTGGILSFDGTEKIEGTHSLEFDIPGEGVHIATLATSLDLTSIGGAAGSKFDIHRIYAFCNKWKKVNQVKIDVDVSAGGDFETDYYTVTLDRSFLRGKSKAWARLEIRRSGKGDDSLPRFTREGSTAGRDWSTVTALRITVDARKAVTVRFDLWDVLGSEDGQVSGEDLEYYFTYVNDDGHESNPSPKSDSIEVKNQGIDLSDLTASADPQVTGKHIYRRGGTIGVPLRVTVDPVPNATTTYTDTASDDDLTDLGIRLRTDNDLPPAAQGAIGPYLGYTFAWSSADFPNRFWWSRINRPWAFPGADLDTGNWNNIGGDEDEILSATMRPRMVLFYTKRGIWRLTGSPDDVSGNCETTGSLIGAVGRRAVVMAGEYDYFVSDDGVYQFNGDTPRRISDAIDPIFNGETTTIGFDVEVLPISRSEIDQCVLGHKNGTLYLSYPQEGAEAPDQTLACDLATGRWFQDSRGFEAFFDEGTLGSFLAGTGDGKLLEIESGDSDEGTPVAIVYHSRYHDQQLPNAEKTYEDVVIEIDTGGVSLPVYLYTNNGDAKQFLGFANTTSREQVIFQIHPQGTGTKARNAAVRIGEGEGAPCTFGVTPLSASYPAAGGTGEITVETLEGCDWTAVSNDEWITIDSGSSGTGNGTTDYTVDPNTDPDGRVGTITIAGQTHTVTQEGTGGCVYVLALDIEDVSEFEVTTFAQTTGSYPRAMQIVEHYLFAQSEGSNVLQTFDLDDTPTAPTLIDSNAYGGNAPKDFFIVDGYAYLSGYNTSNGDAVLSIYDASSLDNLSFSGALVYTQNPRRVRINGNHAYVFHIDGAIAVISVASKVTPVLVNQDASTLATPKHLALDGDHIFVTTNNGLEIFSITNPTSPTRVGSLAISGTPEGLCVSGELCLYRFGWAVRQRRKCSTSCRGRCE